MGQMTPQPPDQAFRTAVALQQQGNAAAACEIFRQLLPHFPGSWQLLYSYGTALLQLEQAAEALPLLEAAIAGNPDFPGAPYNYGNALCRLGRHADALAYYDRAIALAPNISGAYIDRGNALMQLRRYKLALTDYDTALRLDGRTAEGLFHRGTALAKLLRFADALADFDQAIQLSPHTPELFCCRGHALHELARFPDAIASYRQALKLRPQDADALTNLGRLLQLTGRTEEGRQLYENRWRRASFQKMARHYSQPQWCGEGELAGKRLFIWHEQGLGDFIQCARFATLAAARGAKVLLETPAPLADLMQTLKGDITQLPFKSDPPDFDLHVPIMRLPLAFAADEDLLARTVPYLKADPARIAVWHDRLGEKKRPRIGLCLSGNPAHSRDRLRSVPARQGAPLLALPFDFHLLQPEVQAEERTLNLIPHTDDITDFADTAALMHEMDLILTVDTSVAHLAGALGLPVWILLAKVPDYRWMLEREDSPLYPTARLFRQKKFGDWQDLLQRVSASLQETFHF